MSLMRPCLSIRAASPFGYNRKSMPGVHLGHCRRSRAPIAIGTRIAKLDLYTVVTPWLLRAEDGSRSDAHGDAVHLASGRLDAPAGFH